MTFRPSQNFVLFVASGVGLLVFMEIVSFMRYHVNEWLISAMLIWLAVFVFYFIKSLRENLPAVKQFFRSTE